MPLVSAANGVEFLRVPATYYDGLEHRVGGLGQELATLRDLGVLVDHDEWGRLLQILRALPRSAELCFSR